VLAPAPSPPRPLRPAPPQEGHKALQQQHAALQAQAAAKGLANIELQKELQTQWSAGEPAMLQLKQLLLDPAVNREFTRLGGELEEARGALRGAQDELRAVTFTAVRAPWLRACWGRGGMGSWGCVPGAGGLGKGFFAGWVGGLAGWRGGSGLLRKA
jgi:hypothetical protein